MALVGPGSSPDLLESLGLACKTGPVSLASALLLDWRGVWGLLGSFTAHSAALLCPSSVLPRVWDLWYSVYSYLPSAS